MHNPQYGGRPPSWQAQYGQPQMDGQNYYPPQRPLSHPNSPNLRPQQPYDNGYAPPYYPASTPSSRPTSPYWPGQPHHDQPYPPYGAPPQQASPYLQPQGPPAYGQYPPPGHGYPPPPPGPPPAHGMYTHHPTPAAAAQQQYQPPHTHAHSQAYSQAYPHPRPHHPPSQVLLLKRESDGTTLTLHGPDARPLYQCTDTGRSSMSSRPDFVISRHHPSGGGAPVGSVRYHYWLSMALDYWEVGGARGGTGLFAWRAEHADARCARWACRRESDGVGVSDAGALPVARLTFDWDANSREEDGSGDVVVGRCEIFDAGMLLNPARAAEMDEFYVTAVVTLDAGAKALARAKERHGEIKDWEKFAKKLERLAESGGYEGGDGGGDGGDGGDGGGGDGGGGGGG
ncbi:hypothetical protein GGR54DRAFT_283272 [Hypoxylon sp. NC1633]|nr:hypothetical protein GGR54DRAFT_283272 [Hypoxylon sp. NC1633]